MNKRVEESLQKSSSVRSASERLQTQPLKGADGRGTTNEADGFRGPPRFTREERLFIDEWFAFAAREPISPTVAAAESACPDDPRSLPQWPAGAPPDAETLRRRLRRRPAHPARCRPRALASRRPYRGPDPRPWR